MTRHELIDAYADGRIGRRDFVQRLTALGVSSAAAAAYAVSLAPAAAASGRTEHGYIARAQGEDADGPYGVPVEVCDALDALIDVVQALIGAFEGLVAIFPALQAVVDFLEEALEFLEELRDSLCGAASRSPFPTIGSVGITRFAQGSPSAEDEAALEELARDFDALVGLYTYTVPAIEDLEARRALMSIAMVTARQAAYVRGLAGLSPAPASLEQPLTPDEAQAELEADSTA